jgi:4-coumarate--CoA ligase
LTRALIAGFKAAGLKPGDVVCVHAFNSILYPILCFGIIGAGGVFVGSNPAYKSLELRHLVSATEPKFCVVEAGILENALPAFMTLVPLARTFVLGTDVVDCNLHGCRDWRDLLRHGEQDWRRIKDTGMAKSTVAVLQSTSGTTGLPKVAVSSHYALVASGVAMRESTPRLHEVTRLISLPLFHSFGASFVQISAFYYGEPTYIMHKFDAEDFGGLLCRFKITEIAVVPTMLASMVNQRTSPLVLKTLRSIWCAGLPLSAELSKAMYELLHEEAIICQVWGMTEFGRITSSDSSNRDDDGSVGRLLPNAEARYFSAYLLVCHCH